MRRYRIEIRGREFEIDVDELTADRFNVVVGGETYEVKLASDADLPEAQITPQLSPRGATPPAPAMPAPREPAPRPAPTAGAPGKPPAPAGTLVAPMPGVIVEVNAAVGAKVRRGDVVAVLEAMKMNNMIRAPRDGTVAEVFVVQGQSVGHGDAILRFEAA